MKLTADPAFERARRRGLVGGDVDEFQRSGGDVAIRALRVARERGAAPRRARLHAERLSARARRLVGRPRRARLGPPEPGAAAARAAAARRAARRARLDGPTLAFAGRLTAQKSLGVALEARRGERRRRAPRRGRRGRARAARAPRRGARARRPRPLPRPAAARARARALPRGRRRDPVVGWENFPHTVVEALAVGTPVIATAVGRRRRRSCATARTACSSRPETRPRSPTRSAASSPTRRCGSGCVPPRRRSVAAYAPERSSAARARRSPRLDAR